MKFTIILLLLMSFVISFSPATAENGHSILSELSVLYSPERFEQYSADLEHYYVIPGAKPIQVFKSFRIEKLGEFYQVEKIFVEEDGNTTRYVASWDGTVAVYAGLPSHFEIPDDGIPTYLMYQIGPEKFEADKTELIAKFMHSGLLASYKNFDRIDLDSTNDTVVMTDDYETVRLHLNPRNPHQFEEITITEQDGALVSSTLYSDWTSFGEMSLPKLITRTQPATEGMFEEVFAIEKFEVPRDLETQDFRVKIPYTDQFSIYDHRIKDAFPVHRLDRELVEAGRYYEAIDRYQLKLAPIEDLAALVKDNDLDAVADPEIEPASSPARGDAAQPSPAPQVPQTEAAISGDASGGSNNLLRYGFLGGFAVLVAALGFFLMKPRRAS
ncbi:MAG: hypothetical protein RLY93_18105 [Sumerlaeia bacterium]